MYNIGIEFEYDAEKSRSNMKKHGISFEDAKQLWFVVNVGLAANEDPEKRYLIVGELQGKLFTCVFTYRGNKVRLISARRSRESEERKYYEKLQKKEDDNSQRI